MRRGCVIALVAGVVVTIVAFGGLAFMVWSVIGEKSFNGCPPKDFTPLDGRPITFPAQIVSVGVLDYEEDAGDALLFLSDRNDQTCEALYKKKYWPGPRSGWITIHAEFDTSSMEPPIVIRSWTVP